VLAMESNGLIRDSILRGQTGALAVADVLPLSPGHRRGRHMAILSSPSTSMRLKSRKPWRLTSVYPRKDPPIFCRCQA